VKKVKGEPVSIPTSLEVDASIRNEDLIAIQVAAAEEELNNEKKRLNALVDSKNKEKEEQKKKLDAAVDKAAKVLFGSRVETIIKALKALGLKKLESTIIGAVNRKQVSMKVDKDSVTIACRVTSSIKGASADLAFTKSRMFNGKEAVFVRKIEALGKEIDELQDKRVEVNQHLAQINTLERRARANLATVILNQTAEGKKLLANISVKPLLALENGRK